MLNFEEAHRQADRVEDEGHRRYIHNMVKKWELFDQLRGMTMEQWEKQLEETRRKQEIARTHELAYANRLHRKQQHGEELTEQEWDHYNEMRRARRKVEEGLRWL